MVHQVLLKVSPSFLFPDPYVKVSLMCDGRRLKKRKTSTKRNTLNPVYNEAIVFDVPPENIDQISLLIAVMDYDRFVRLVSLCDTFTDTTQNTQGCNYFLSRRVGHNEVIGVCRVGNEAESLGRDHWSEMLTYPRKPIAHWHPLIEVGPACCTGELHLCRCSKMDLMHYITVNIICLETWYHGNDQILILYLIQSISM